MQQGKTRATTSAEYLRRINQALQFIDQHLDQVIRLEDVASASHFSPYHFHRIFHALVGETVNDYVARKRMEQAAKCLVYKPGMSVTNIAAAGGFSSAANFAKAFKLYFGLSPTELRNGQLLNPEQSEKSKNGKLFRKYGKVFRPQDMYSQFVTQTRVFDPDKLENMLMQVKVEEVQEKSIVFLSSPKGYVLDSVYATWDKMTHWAKLKGIAENGQARLGICHDNPTITPEDKCRYDAAIVIDEDVVIQPPYTKATIPAGKYAIAYYKDSAAKISNFMTEFCANWLCKSGYEPDNYPPVFHYLNDSRKDEYVEMDVYIKLKALVVS